MRAIIFKGPGEWALEERPVPEIQNPDDVKIKVLGVGICGTDLHILMNPPMHPAKPGIIFGHEFCGQVVDSLGAGLQRGAHVVLRRVLRKAKDLYDLFDVHLFFLFVSRPRGRL